MHFVDALLGFCGALFALGEDGGIEAVFRGLLGVFGAFFEAVGEFGDLVFRVLLFVFDLLVQGSGLFFGAFFFVGELLVQRVDLRLEVGDLALEDFVEFLRLGDGFGIFRGLLFGRSLGCDKGVLRVLQFFGLLIGRFQSIF